MPPKEDAIDVEFETVAGQNPSNSERKQEPIPDPKGEGEEQLSVFGKGPNKPENKAMPLSLFTLVAAVCSVGAFYLAGGHSLFISKQTQTPVVAAPQTSEILPEQKLQINDITTNVIERSDMKVLTIRATIANNDEIARTLPAIIVRIGDDPATTRMFRINRGETLKPGERLVFTNSLPVGNAPVSKPILTFAE